MLIPRQPEFNLTEGILPLVAFPCWQQSAINEPHRWCIAHFECGRIGVVMFSVLTSSVVESVFHAKHYNTDSTTLEVSTVNITTSILPLSRRAR
jgi:hypothetical protein